MSLSQHADRFSGCLVGECLGDALGFPVEGEPPEICASYVERLRSLGAKDAMPAGHGYSSGQYTDVIRNWRGS